MSFELFLHLPLGIIETLGTAGTLLLYASLAASAAGSAISYKGQQDAAKQTELNAGAQNKAIGMERQRKAAELAENQRRLAVQERRERAAQFSTMASTGFVATTGTPLAIVSDTLGAQQQRRADLSNDASLTDWGLATRGQTLLQEAGSQSRQMRTQAGASLLSGLSSTAKTAYSFT